MGTEKTQGNKRNYGIDLLRILSMLYVVILHCLGKGGVLDGAIAGTPQYAAAWFLETWAYCAVNIFAIISGYVGYTEVEKRTKYSSYLLMWLQVVFCGATVTVAFQLIKPEAVRMKDLIDMFLPVSNDLYWYFTAYTALFFIMPLLNASIRNCSEKQLKGMLVTIFVIYICYDNVVRKFGMSTGYSFLWLIILYLIGAIMKKCRIGEKIKPLKAIIGVVLLILVSWIWKMYGFEGNVLGIKITKRTLLAYTSPTMVAAAMLYIIGFSKIKFPKWSEKAIVFLAKGAFAVYLFNNQRFIWNYVMNQNFAFLAEKPVVVLLGAVLLFSVGFVIAAILVDHVRMLLFRIFRINALVQKVSEVFHFDKAGKNSEM